MRISDWSSDVCSSDLIVDPRTLDDAEQAMAERRNVGVRLRLCDLVVDVDPRNFDDGDDPVKRLEELLGRSLDAWPTVMTGSGGRHHYMIVPEGFLAMDSVADFPGIEFKGHGRQVVAPGSSHPNTGDRKSTRLNSSH